MNVKIVENNDYPSCHDLLVNGHVKIEAESFTVCCEVKYALVHNLGGEYGECGEIAESIRKSL